MSIENWADTKAAYRFFQNENIEYRNIVDQHACMTMSRFTSEELVFAIQDTSYFQKPPH